jgi:hypothetical protein
MTTIPAYFSGDTVRFSATFRDYPDDPEDPPETGTLLDPATVEVTIFDGDYLPIHEGPGVNDSQGVYQFDYTMPSEPGLYYIEWKGTVNSKPEIKRDRFYVGFWVEA